MDRARWGRLSGVGTSWTLLAASVLVVASSLSRGQAGACGGGRGAGLCRCQQGGDTASTTRRSGLGCTGVSAECDTCERRRQLGVRVWEAGTCTYACTEDGARAVWPLGGRPALLRGAALVGGAAQRARARERRRSGGAGWGGTLAKRLWGASAKLHWRTRVSGGKRPYLRSMRAPLLQPGCDPGVGAPSG